MENKLANNQAKNSNWVYLKYNISTYEQFVTSVVTSWGYQWYLIKYIMLYSFILYTRNVPEQNNECHNTLKILR